MQTDWLRAIARSARVENARVSPDGGLVAMLKTEDGRTELHVAPVDRSHDERRLTSHNVPSPEHGDAGPDWSPNGRWIATLSPSSGGSDVVLVNVADGSCRVLTDGHRSCASPRWSTDGHSLAFLVARKPELRNIEDTPPAWDVSVEHDDPRYLNAEYGGVALWIVSADGASFTRVAFPESSILDASWLPDSSGLVATALDPRTASGRLVQIDLVGGGTRVRDLVEPDGRQFRAPRVARDGRLAYLDDVSGRFEVHLRDVTRVDTEAYAITDDGRDKAELAWTGDDHLVFTTFNSGFFDLASVRPDPRGTPRVHIEDEAVIRSLSVSGSVVAFVAESTVRPPHVEIVELDTGERHEFPDGAVVGLVDRLATPFVPRRYISSDGLEIEGFLALPDTPVSDPPPLIVYPHGGPTSVFLRSWQPFLGWLTKQGYAVFAPNFRGSTMYGREFELANDGDWGGGDLQDVVRAVEVLGEEGLIDPARAAIFGGSYGGYLTLLALVNEPDVFRCGISLYAVANRYSSWLTTDRSGRHNMEKEMGSMATRREAYEAVSPLFGLERVRAPLLILHGEDDPRVPVGQSRELVAGLKRAGAFHVFATYEGEGHGFRQPEHVEDVYARVTAFLRSFL